MNLELIILVTTVVLILNVYYDGHILTTIKSYKKHGIMALYGIAGFCLYLLVKQNPYKSRELLNQASNVVKYMPIDRESSQLLGPVFNLTQSSLLHNQPNNANNANTYSQQMNTPQSNMQQYQTSKILNSGKKATKRSVSETKKKWVASNQDWKCRECTKKLPAWYEVDHKVRLEYGGTNHVDNLVALCRDCHGRKTASENL